MLVRYGWVHVEVESFVGVVGGSQAGGSQVEEKVVEGTEVVESTVVGMEVEAALDADMEAEDDLEAGMEAEAGIEVAGQHKDRRAAEPARYT